MLKQKINQLLNNYNWNWTRDHSKFYKTPLNLLPCCMDYLQFQCWSNWHLVRRKTGRFKTVYNTSSCFGFRVPVCRFRVPVVCNASLFCVMHWRITQHVRGGALQKSGALQKRWRITKNWDQKPANWYPKPETRTSVIAVLGRFLSIPLPIRYH